MVRKGWILFDIVANMVLYCLIVALSLRLLFKIKLKLNLATKSIFYLNLLALALRILFTFWQYVVDNFQSSAGK